MSLARSPTRSLENPVDPGLWLQSVRLTLAGFRPDFDFYQGCCAADSPSSSHKAVLAPAMGFDKVLRILQFLLILSVLAVCGCEDLMVRDTSSLLVSGFQRSEVVGIVAGFGTTFAAMPDLIAMLKRRSNKGMNPRMAAIMGIFQVIWVYYGLLIESRPVIVWNVVAVIINFLNVGAYLHFSRSASR